MSIILALRVDKTKTIRRGQAYLWQVIRDLTAADRARPIFLDEIMARMAGTDRSVVRLDLGRMAKAGLISLTTSTAGPCWTVLKRPTRLPSLGKAGAAPRSGQEAMWTAMRALREFSPREIALTASTVERPVSLQTARTYVQRLNGAGYFTVVAPATSRSLAVYRLKPAMNGGPDAPRVLRTHLIYDPNRNEVMGEAEAEDAS